MFGLGGAEMGILVIIILLVFGPSQIPKMARSIGEAMREFRKAQREISDEIQRDEPAKKPPDNKPVQ
jgi:sec-independent protein translocase protein TatA